MYRCIDNERERGWWVVYILCDIYFRRKTCLFPSFSHFLIFDHRLNTKITTTTTTNNIHTHTTNLNTYNPSFEQFQTFKLETQKRYPKLEWNTRHHSNSTVISLSLSLSLIHTYTTTTTTTTTRSEEGTPIYLENEVVWRQCSKVTLYQNDEKLENFREGLGIVSNYRVIWIDRERKVAKYWNLKDVSRVEKEEAGWFQGSEKVVLRFTSSRDRFLKLKFKNGETDDVIRDTKSALKKQSWTFLEKKKKDKSKDNKTETVFRPGAGGIREIIRRQQQEQARAKKVASSAFKDLDSLMENAKKVVQIAEKYAAKMKAESEKGENNKDTAQFTSLVRTVGITSPVTREAVGDDLYFSELARQLAGFLKKPLQDAGGMLQLISIYGLYNRARGTDLISPDDLLTSCKMLSKLRLKMSLRKLKSGVLVVRLDSHSEQAISKRLLEFVRKNQFVSPATLASKWRVSVVIAKEYLQVAEQDGSLCRDESQEGVRFWANRFLGK